MVPGKTEHKFKSSPPNDHSTWFKLAQWFQRSQFLNEIPIGSHVKLNRVMAAIMDDAWEN